MALPAQAQVNVSLDRYSIAPADTVQLTLEVDQRAAQRPDFSPLTRDFHFLGSKQMTVSSHSNGNNQYTTRWRVLLRPRHSGELQIPPLQINNEQSTPLLLSVAGDKSSTAAINRDSFLESNVDTSELYINSQLLYSQRLYHRAELPPMANFSEPLIEHANTIALGETNRYSTQLKGETYQVIEKNYAIFPEQTGQLTIPAATFSAGPGIAELQSEAFSIDVLPQANQKKKGYWLPSSQVSITDNWQRPDTITPATPITRQITISATGLPAAALPALMPLRNELASIEVTDVSLSQEYSSKGVISSRTETILITPLERGEITLPEIRIPWWNITKDRAEQSIINPIILRVEAGSKLTSGQTQAAEATPPLTSEITATDGSALSSSKTVVTSAHEDLNQQTVPAQPAPDNSHFLIWLLTAIAVISALGWLYSYAALRRLKQQLDTDGSQTVEEEVELSAILPQHFSDDDDFNYDAAELLKVELAERDAFQAALSACEQNMALEARLLMLEWGRQFWPEIEINSSIDLSDICNSKTLDLLLIDMENHIDGTETDYWSGDLLAEALDKIREKQLSKRFELS
ncbi:BatD family protein [Amphritea sp. HPY]|uniref:BatD family protein n=1 Tax=Amphritea sp. HPY TaxID=3421652 RepID=UPI003D7CE446